VSVFGLHRAQDPSAQDQSLSEHSVPDTRQKADRAVRRESKLTFGGFLYIGVTVFLAIGAVNSQNNLLFWLFGVAIATIFVSGLISGNALMRTRLHAKALHEVHAGQRVHLHYTITNQSRFFPLFACLVTEFTPSVIRRGRLLPASVVHIAPNSASSSVGSFVPMHRGRVILRDIRLSTRFPFGLLQKALVFEQPRPLMVLPHPLRLRSDLLTHTRTQGEDALRRSMRGGHGNEFWGLREYRPGDPRRRIAWKQSARRDSLVVVEQAESFSMRIWIVIIEPDSNEDTEHLHAERAIAIAGSIFERNAKRSMPLGLWYPQRDVRFDPLTGRAHAGRVLRTLATVNLDEKPAQFIPVPTRTRDRVVLIQRGERVSHPVSTSRIIDTARPEQWLIDPGSLPVSLGGAS
jgi:uncharacterized protein (DUF58 family)